jgi:hypothetical protein
MLRGVAIVLIALVIFDVYFLDSKYINAGIQVATQIARWFGF